MESEEGEYVAETGVLYVGSFGWVFSGSKTINISIQFSAEDASGSSLERACE
jgi:hypothetical protein